MKGLEKARYEAQRSFRKRIAEKETQNPSIIAKVGNGAGTVVVPSRTGWIYVRLHGDNNQLTQAKLGIPLNPAELDDSWVRVRRASPRKASYYVVEQFISSGAGDPTPPLQAHALDPDAGPHTGTLPEAKVVFGDTGHPHSGGAGGKKVSHPDLLGVTAGQHHEEFTPVQHDARDHTAVAPTMDVNELADSEGRLLTGVQKTDLTDGGFTTIHQHAGGGGAADSLQIILTNRTGGERTAGDVVVVDVASDESFTGTVQIGYAGKVFVVAETIANLTGGRVWERGGPFDVKVTGVVERNDGLRTSPTIYRAEAAPSIVGGDVFAIALSPNITGEGTVKAVFLDAIGGGGGGGATIYTSTYGSPPASPVEGDLWLPSDSFYTLRRGPAAWVPWGPIFPMTPPASADFSWVNQGGASIDTTPGGVYLLAPAGAGNNLRIRIKAAPAPPYIITAALLPHKYIQNYAYCGLVWRQSADGKLVAFAYGLSANQLSGDKFTSPTAWSANYFLLTTRPADPLFLRIADDGVNRICSWSADGQHFHPIHTIARTDFLTANQVGFFADANNATYPCGITVLSWKET